MSAIDFPDNPADGDEFTAPGGITWVFQDPLWVLLATGGGGGSDGFTFIQDTVPTATAAGQTWFDTSTSTAFVWVVDADSAQWVQYAPGGGGGGAGSDGFTFVQDTVPSATAAGQTWFDTRTGDALAWFEDADSSQWVQFGPGSGGGSDGFTFVQDTVPSATAAGQTWLDTRTGNTFTWYADANSSQWVQTAGGIPRTLDPMLIQAGTVRVTTDVFGLFVVPYPVSFRVGTSPVVTLTYAELNQTGVLIVFGSNAADFAGQATGRGTVPLIINYIAVGERA